MEVTDLCALYGSVESATNINLIISSQNKNIQQKFIIRISGISSTFLEEGKSHFWIELHCIMASVYWDFIPCWEPRSNNQTQGMWLCSFHKNSKCCGLPGYSLEIRKVRPFLSLSAHHEKSKCGAISPY